MPKAAQRQFLVSVSGVDGYFATKTGGATVSEVSDVWDGGALLPEKLAAPQHTENVTVGRPYDPERDAPVVKRLRPVVGRLRTTLAVQPTDADLVKLGDPQTYPHALLIGLNDPEADAASGNAARLELVFAIESVT